MKILHIIGSKIRNGFREVKADVSGDTLDNMQVTPYGFDSVPINGLNAVISETQTKSIVIGYIQKAVSDLNNGDSITFAKNNNGEITSSIIHRTDGAIEINSSEDVSIISSGTVDINNGNLTIEA